MILCVDLDDTLASSGKTINEYAIKFDKDILKRATKIKKIDNCVDYYYFLLGCAQGMQKFPGQKSNPLHRTMPDP